MFYTNSEINFKKEERKHSWSTVFAWLYLRTIGRIFPRWNRLAENILYFNKITVNNEVQADDFRKLDESVKINLGPEAVERKESKSKSVLIKKNEVSKKKNRVALSIKKMYKNVNSSLRPGIAKRDGKNEDGEIRPGINDRSTCKTNFNIQNELTMSIHFFEMSEENNGTLKEQLNDTYIINKKLELEHLQNIFLKELQSVIKELKKIYTENLSKRGKEIIECKMEIMSKISKLSDEKEVKMNNFTYITLEQDKKVMYDNLSSMNVFTVHLQKNFQESKQESKLKLEKGKSNNTKQQRQQTELEQDICKSGFQKEKAKFKAVKEKHKMCKENKNRLLANRLKNLESILTEINKNKKKNLESNVYELQKQIKDLKMDEEWKLAGIDGSLKETFLNIIVLVEQQLLINNQEQSIKEKKLKELTISCSGQDYQIAGLQAKNFLLKVKNERLISVIERSIAEEAEARKIDERLMQNQHKLIDQIKRLEEALKKKGEQLKESKSTLESLEYKLESLESQTVRKVREGGNIPHQIDSKHIIRSKANLFKQRERGREMGFC